MFTDLKEVCIRLGHDDDFTCTVRYAGIRLWRKGFSCTVMEGILGKVKAHGKGHSFRWADGAAEDELSEQ
jgi:hypothetical protein